MQEVKEGVELKRYHSSRVKSDRVDRMNAFSVSTDAICIAKVIQNLAPSIIIHIDFGGSRLRISRFLLCFAPLSKCWSIFGFVFRFVFHSQWDCHFPIKCIFAPQFVFDILRLTPCARAADQWIELLRVWNELETSIWLFTKIQFEIYSRTIFSDTESFFCFAW